MQNDCVLILVHDIYIFFQSISLCANFEIQSPVKLEVINMQAFDFAHVVLHILFV